MKIKNKYNTPEYGRIWHMFTYGKIHVSQKFIVNFKLLLLSQDFTIYYRKLVKGTFLNIFPGPNTCFSLISLTFLNTVHCFGFFFNFTLPWYLFFFLFLFFLDTFIFSDLEIECLFKMGLKNSLYLGMQIQQYRYFSLVWEILQNMAYQLLYF